MPRIDTGLAHQLVYRRRLNRFWRLLGCAMLLAGLSAAIAPWLAPAAGVSPRALRTSTLLGTAAAAFGIVLVFGRRVKRFDKAAGTLSIGFSVIMPLEQEVFELQRFHVVLLGPLDSSDASRWQVALGGAEGDFLQIFALPRETAARSAADEIAVFLGWPVALLPAAPPASLPPDSLPPDSATAPDRSDDAPRSGGLKV